jgi:hypothetical protein
MATSTPNFQPITPLTTPRASTRVTVANTGRDGSGVINSFVTAGTAGAVIGKVTARTGVTISAVSTAMVSRLWHQVGGTGTWFLLDELAITTVTPSNTVIGTTFTFAETNIPLGPNDTLGVTQSIAEAMYYTGTQANF